MGSPKHRFILALVITLPFPFMMSYLFLNPVMTDAIDGQVLGKDYLDHAGYIQNFALHYSPAMMLILGYYFGSSQAQSKRSDDGADRCGKGNS